MRRWVRALTPSQTTVRGSKKAAEEAIQEYDKTGCVERVAQVGGASFIVGGLMGAVSASWSEASHAGVERSTFASALKDTSRGIGRYSLMFGVAGAMFAIGDCGAQTFRNKQDWYNQAVGGCFAGFTVSAAVTRSPISAFGSCLALGAITGVFAMLPAFDRPSARQQD